MKLKNWMGIIAGPSCEIMDFFCLHSSCTARADKFAHKYALFVHFRAPNHFYMIILFGNSRKVNWEMLKGIRKKIHKHKNNYKFKLMLDGYLCWLCCTFSSFCSKFMGFVHFFVVFSFWWKGNITINIYLCFYIIIIYICLELYSYLCFFAISDLIMKINYWNVVARPAPSI